MLTIDDERVHTSRAILARLEELEPEPALYPADRADAVREAEQWGDEQLQDLGRRMPWGALHFRPEAMGTFGGAGPLDGPGTDFAIKLIRGTWKYHGLSAELLANDLKGLPAKLDHIDQLAADGVIGTEEADLHRIGDGPGLPVPERRHGHRHCLRHPGFGQRSQPLLRPVRGRHRRRDVGGRPGRRPAAGIPLQLGAPVQWTYVVTNTGGAALNNILVTDDRGAAVTCPGASLAPGASMTCTASGTTVSGLFTNVAKVQAPEPCGGVVSDTDASHYNTPVLEFATTNDYRFIWNDSGSAADRDGGFARPVPPAGYFFLGDYGQGNYEPPTQSVATVRVREYDNPASPALAPPAGYREIWRASS